MLWQEPIDRAKRDELIEQLLDPKPPPALKSGPLAGYFSGGGDAMAIPREQIQERLFQLISNLGITFGLIFSGVAGSALSPFNVEDFDAGSSNRTLANIYNLLANMQFVLSLMGMMTTLMHMLPLSFENEQTIYRFAIRLMPSLWALATLVYNQVFFLIAQLGIVIYMKCDPIYAHVTVAIMLVQLYTQLGSHMAWFVEAAPTWSVHHLNDPVMKFFARGFGAFSKSQKTLVLRMARRIGAIKEQEVATSFGADVVHAVRDKIVRSSDDAAARADTTASADEDDEQHGREGMPTAATPNLAASKEARKLEAFLRSALPAASAERVTSISIDLLRNDLDLPVLVEASRDRLVLDKALSDPNLALNLRPGERLAVVSGAAAANAAGLAGRDARDATPPAAGALQDPLGGGVTGGQVVPLVERRAQLGVADTPGSPAGLLPGAVAEGVALAGGHFGLDAGVDDAVWPHGRGRAPAALACVSDSVSASIHEPSLRRELAPAVRPERIVLPPAAADACVSEWSPRRVGSFMEALAGEFGAKASAYAAAMRAEDVSGRVLVGLSEADLRELGLSLGHRKAFLDHLARLRRQ